MRIGIVGFGREGKHAYEYWNKNGNTFAVFDKSQDVSTPEGVTLVAGDRYKDDLVQASEHLDLIVRSPGVALWDIEDKLKAPVTTITKEFFDVCPCPIIGITGTKGKGTTATLIYSILKEAKKDVYLVGNIGTPALSVLPNLTQNSLVVYELSSFQLYDLHKSPQTAVCLLVTEDHLDWHKDLEQYHASKGSIFKHQQESDVAIWYTKNETSVELSKLSHAKKKVPYGPSGITRVEHGYFMHGDEMLCPTSEAKLPGAHNQQNICAAIAATWGLASKENILAVIRTFSGLPYHIETVGVHNGITFINDSFAANPTATEVAIASVGQATTLIIGGVDRGLHLEPFVKAIKESRHITNIISFGQERGRIKDTLQEHNISCVVIDGSLKDVFTEALALTKQGGNILFSPGAPSFDMFANYEERGKAFNALVAQYKDGLL